QLIISGREITILIQVSDYEFCRCPNSRTNIHGAELPKQMISKSGRLGKKNFKGKPLNIFEVASASVTGIKIVAEKRTKIYLVEWIFFFFRRSGFTIRWIIPDFRAVTGFAITGLLASSYFIEQRH